MSLTQVTSGLISSLDLANTTVTGTISSAQGGTGVNNGSNIITIGGSVTFSGANNFVGTVAGPTSITFPTTGTLVTTAGSETLTNKVLTNPTITNYVESIVTLGTVNTAVTLSLTTGTIIFATLTANTSCTFTMPTPTAGKSFMIFLRQDPYTGNGSSTFTGVNWNSAGAPIVTTSAGSLDVISFIADGTKWYGSYNQGYTA